MKRIFSLSVLVLVLFLTSCTKRNQEKIIGFWREENSTEVFEVTETHFDGTPYSIKGSRISIDDETYRIVKLTNSEMKIRVDPEIKVTFNRE